MREELKEKKTLEILQYQGDASSDSGKFGYKMLASSLNK